MRQLAISLALVSSLSCLADIGLVSQNAEKTWALYGTQDAQQVVLAQCQPPVASPQRDCPTAVTAQKVSRQQFLNALQTRLHLFAAVQAQKDVDYLSAQSARLAAKLADTTLPPSSRQALESTKLLVDTKLKDAKQALAGADVQANLAFYRKIVSSLEAGHDWVIDEVESPADYGMKVPTYETSLLSFLLHTFQANNLEGAATGKVELSTDPSFDHAEAVVVDPISKGYAVTGSSNEFSRPERHFASQIVFYGSNGQQLWEDVSSDFHAEHWGDKVIVTTGEQSFALIGVTEAKQAAVRFVTAVNGVPTAKVIYYEPFQHFVSIHKTKSGDLLLAATKDDSNTLLVVSAKDGAILKQVPVFANLNKAKLAGALETSTGAFAAYGTHGHCLAVAQLTAKFDNVSWQREACSPSKAWEWLPETSVATANGEFVIGGQESRWIDEKDREDEWDVQRHRSILVGFGPNGYPTFRHVSREVRHWGEQGYKALVYNPAKDEIAAAGCEPYAGVVDIFDRYGNFLLHAVEKSHYNTDFTGISLLPDGSGYLIAGTVGTKYPSHASYVAAYAVLKR